MIRIIYCIGLTILIGTLAVVFFVVGRTAWAITDFLFFWANLANVLLSIDTRIRKEYTNGRNRSTPRDPGDHAGTDTDPYTVAADAIARVCPVLSCYRARPNPGLVEAYQHDRLGMYSSNGTLTTEYYARAIDQGELCRESSTEPIIAYRWWRTFPAVGSEIFLLSAYRSGRWAAGEPMKGDVDERHPTFPYGVHAYAALDDTIWNMHMGGSDIKSDSPLPPYAVLGTVSLWGKVVVCERGYRAQFAYPHQLCWTNAPNPQETLQALARKYGVEVHAPLETRSRHSEES